MENGRRGAEGVVDLRVDVLLSSLCECVGTNVFDEMN